MIRIRMAALGVALVFGLAATAEAQSGQGQDRRGDRPRAEQGGRRGAGMAMQLMRGIELTDAQKTQLKALHQRQLAERDSVRDARGGERPDSAGRAAMLAMAERHHSAMRAILTPAQQATFDRNVAEMRERAAKRGDGRGERRGGGRRGGGQGQPRGGN